MKFYGPVLFVVVVGLLWFMYTVGTSFLTLMNFAQRLGGLQ